MPKPREPWNIRPTSTSTSVTASLKVEVETKAKALIDGVLTPPMVRTVSWPFSERNRSIIDAGISNRQFQWEPYDSFSIRRFAILITVQRPVECELAEL